MKKVLFFSLFVLLLSACSKNGQKNSAKCGTRQAKKKVAYYLSIPHQ